MYSVQLQHVAQQNGCIHLVIYFHHILVMGDADGLIVSVLYSRWSALGLIASQGHCVEFLGKTGYSHIASLQSRQRNKNTGGLPAMDWSPQLGEYRFFQNPNNSIDEPKVVSLKIPKKNPKSPEPKSNPKKSHT